MEHSRHFYLGPHELGLPLVTGFLEPKPFSHEGADEVAVVASADVKLERSRVVLDV